MSNRVLLATTVSLLVLGGFNAELRATYSVTDLGSLGGSSYAMAINNSGQVVGFSFLTSSTSGDYRAFLYDNGAMTDLLGANYPYSAAYGINDSGKIAGGVGGGQALFTYDHGTVFAGNFGGTYCEAYAINNGGVIAGYAYLPSDTNSYGFIYDGTSASILFDTTPNAGTYTSANAINAGGWAVGGYNTTAGGGHRAFLFDGTYGYDLGTLGGTVADAYAVNAGGLIAGSSTLAGDAARHAFLLDGNATTWTMTDLGSLGGTSEAWGINATGQVVGYSDIASGASHAFLYSSGAMVDLNSLIAPSSGWTIASATAINDSGWIAGFGINAAGDIRALLLKPSTLPTLAGDANGDGTVNGADLNIVLSNYNLTGMDWSQGDFNGDGTVNGADLNTILSNYNQTAGVSSAVPEPGSVVLLLAGVACLLAFAWRRRRS
jgi:probable HAF family extracellular repeat protein